MKRSGSEHGPRKRWHLKTLNEFLRKSNQLSSLFVCSHRFEQIHTFEFNKLAQSETREVLRDMMVAFQSLFHLALTVLLLAALAEGSTRVQDRGYSSSPYEVHEDADTKEAETNSAGRYDNHVGEGRVEGRGFNTGPAEDNVFGVDCHGMNGVYGRVGDFTQADINFKYQLETTPNPTKDEYEAMIDVIEAKALDLVLPLLFSVCYGNRRQLRASERDLKVVGVTANPRDENLNCK